MCRTGADSPAVAGGPRRAGRSRTRAAESTASCTEAVGGFLFTYDEPFGPEVADRGEARMTGPAREWKLLDGSTLLGTVTVVEADTPRHRGSFLAEAAFSQFGPWFDELNAVVESGEFERFDDAYGRIERACPWCHRRGLLPRSSSMSTRTGPGFAGMPGSEHVRAREGSARPAPGPVPSWPRRRLRRSPVPLGRQRPVPPAGQGEEHSRSRRRRVSRPFRVTGGGGNCPLGEPRTSGACCPRGVARTLPPSR